PNSSSFPANYFRNEDETSGLVTEGYVQLVPSKLVEPTTYDALVAQYKMQGFKVQTKPNTKVVSTLIASRVKSNELPPAKVIYGSGSFNLPRVLLRAEWIPSYAIEMGARVSAQVSFDLLLEFRSGPEGMLKTRTTRSFVTQNPNVEPGKAWFTSTAKIVVQ